MYQRFKVTKTSTTPGGKIEVFIDKTKDVEVLMAYVTLPALVANSVRDVKLTRADGTILGTEKAHYETAHSVGLVFPSSFILPSIDPILIVDTATEAPAKDITIELIYREVEFEK